MNLRNERSGHTDWQQYSKQTARSLLVFRERARERLREREREREGEKERGEGERDREEKEEREVRVGGRERGDRGEERERGVD